MSKFTAALFSRAFGPLIALFSTPRGRHSTFGRRRRSTRVRRYAPAPAPLPAPRLAPPSEVLPAEDVALVRPYYAAHERLRASEARVPEPRGPESDEVRREFARVQERAAALLQRWKDDPNGELSGEPAPRFSVVRPARNEWGELASLTRTWIAQHQGVPA
ncbi:hypothetical protein [Nocardiopsis halotolerans]|uniref:hypothetical protein n=1 Tax=Nocardiopsis halotolerans TaxID=124252 RepID=UPI000344AB67|nr:hypothetical protein [Nocardiopsis halotolerans]